jgi:putative endonuclease
MRRFDSGPRLQPPLYELRLAGQPEAVQSENAGRISPLAEAARRSLGEGGHYSHDFNMHYVYLIEGVHDRKQHYVGHTGDRKTRITEHNAGKSIHTSRFKPWNLACYLGFAKQRKAIPFEKYLKSGSGKAFLKRHLL